MQGISWQKVRMEELRERMNRFRAAMNQQCPNWDTAWILSKVNQFYFTGTMQDGILIVRREGEAAYFVRRSYERALDESEFKPIYPIENYREAAAVIGTEAGNAYIETETVPVAMLERLKKAFQIRGVFSLDKALLSVRAIKSPFELEWMERSGALHNTLLSSVVPGCLCEGMSEAELATELFTKMVASGYQGVCRFSMFQTEMVVGQIGFGESSLYPTSFDGPGGAYGLCPAVPFLGSRDRKLGRGDLVFVDIGFGLHGYHSDKTQVYLFGGEPTPEMLAAHKTCIEIQRTLAERLIPGAIPAELYQTVMNRMEPEFLQNFMGFGNRQVKFLGHGIGLHVDEPPVIAESFKTPLAENMVIALEPKKGLPNLGMVGVEDTYIVTPSGGRCITGGGRDIILV